MNRRNVLPASCRQRPAESRPVGPFRARAVRAVRAVCRRDARQHAVRTAVRGPEQRGVRVRLPLGEPIPSRRDQCTVTTDRGAYPTSAADESADEGETEQRSAGDGGKVLGFRDGGAGDGGAGVTGEREGPGVEGHGLAGSEVGDVQIPGAVGGGAVEDVEQRRARRSAGTQAAVRLPITGEGRARRVAGQGVGDPFALETSTPSGLPTRDTADWQLRYECPLLRIAPFFRPDVGGCRRKWGRLSSLPVRRTF